MIYLVTDEQEGGVNGTREEGVIVCCAGWERGFDPGCEREGVGVDLEAELLYFSRSEICLQGEHGSPETMFRDSRLA